MQSSSTMNRLLYVLLLAFALGHCHAQRDRFSMQDGFIFPGPADRPEKFPLNPGGRITTTTPSTVNPGTTTSAPANVENCIRSCPATSEYNPVCGTNNVLYTNPGRLNCARYCIGTELEIKNYGQCGDNNIRG